MKQITITALTDKGEEALREDIKDDMLKMKGIHKALFNTMYRREILTEKPLTLVIICKKSNMNNNPYHILSIKYIMEEAMKKFGASKDDYIIEIKEG